MNRCNGADFFAFLCSTHKPRSATSEGTLITSLTGHTMSYVTWSLATSYSMPYLGVLLSTAKCAAGNYSQPQPHKTFPMPEVLSISRHYCPLSERLMTSLKAYLLQGEPIKNFNRWRFTVLWRIASQPTKFIICWWQVFRAVKEDIRGFLHL